VRQFSIHLRNASRKLMALSQTLALCRFWQMNVNASHMDGLVLNQIDYPTQDTEKLHRSIVVWILLNFLFLWQEIT
jgi:hypothetical protein